MRRLSLLADDGLDLDTTALEHAISRLVDDLVTANEPPQPYYCPAQPLDWQNIIGDRHDA
mgnify:FL=1